MSLLLKSLRQIDSRPLGPAEAEVDEANSSLETSEVEAASRPTEPIPLAALFALPFESSAPVTPPATVVAPAPTTDSKESSVESPLVQLEALRVLLAKAGDEAPGSGVAENRVAAAPRRAPLRIRDEYRDLCDHLRARVAIESHTTLAFIDAGRVANDATWLVPVAAGLLQALEKPGSRPPTALLVEAAGPDAGIAAQLGIDSQQGLCDVLRGDAGAPGWADVVQPTKHPQIDLLCRGRDLPGADQRERLNVLWSELKGQYDLLLVAAGPLQPSVAAASPGVAELFLSVADAAVLCIELDATPRAVAEQAKRALAERGITVAGCVVRGAVSA